jgi:hypothetical protein
LRADRRTKQGGKYIHYTYLEERDHRYETLGEDEWKDDPHGDYGEYCDIEPPAYFAWLFATFLDVYYASRDNVISYPDIQAFTEATQTELSMYEIALIRRMNSWASNENYKAWEESRDA